MTYLTLAEGNVEVAAIEALKQAPGLVLALAMMVFFLKHLSERNKLDAEQRKSDADERKANREALEKNAAAMQNLAIVIEGKMGK